VRGQAGGKSYDLLAGENTVVVITASMYVSITASCTFIALLFVRDFVRPVGLVSRWSLVATQSKNYLSANEACEDPALLAQQSLPFICASRHTHN
jgi:hypothetical protein